MNTSTLTKIEESYRLDALPMAFRRVYWAIWRAAKTDKPAPDYTELAKLHGGRCSQRLLKDHLNRIVLSGLLEPLQDQKRAGWWVPSLGKFCILPSMFNSPGVRRNIYARMTEINAWSASLKRPPTTEEADQFLRDAGPMQQEGHGWTLRQKLYLALYAPHLTPEELAKTIGRSPRQVQAHASNHALIHQTEKAATKQPKVSPQFLPSFKRQNVNSLDHIKPSQADISLGAVMNAYILRQMKLTPTIGCRFIATSRGDQGHPLYCDAPTLPGTSWCQHHWDITHTKPPVGAPADGQDESQTEKRRPGRPRKTNRY